MTAFRSWLVVSWSALLQGLALITAWVLSMVRVQTESPTPLVQPIFLAPDTPTPPAAASMVVRVPIAPAVTPVCEVCGAASTGLRSHDGHWRCLAHKGVRCDVCDRAIPPMTLPDQSWRCSAHG